MSTAARKARKREQRATGAKFQHQGKTPTVAYDERSRPFKGLAWQVTAGLFAQLHPERRAKP